MKVRAEQLYQEMIAAITAQRQQVNKIDMVESCFWIASKYWHILKKNVDKSFFEYERNEIIFFRNIKPKFTAQIQYFATLSESLLFVPADKEDQAAYWKKEMERYKWFCDKNKEFVEYYESGSHHLDNIYFIKMSANAGSLQPLVSFDADKEFCSPQDHLVRSLLAHKMYNEYCKKKLEALVESKES